VYDPLRGVPVVELKVRISYSTGKHSQYFDVLSIPFCVTSVSNNLKNILNPFTKRLKASKRGGNNERLNISFSDANDALPGSTVRGASSIS
jgi:hypothetical protein